MYICKKLGEDYYKKTLGKDYILRFPELQTWAKLWIPHKHLW